MGVVSKVMNHQQQMTLLDQTKTLAESALQMLYAAKEGGGNPKVRCLPDNGAWMVFAARERGPMRRFSGGQAISMAHSLH